MSQSSRINQTGKNFLLAFVISLIPALILTVITSVAAVIFKLTGKEKVDTAAAVIAVAHSFFDTFFGLSTCVVPIVTLFAFALLQRFRLKNPEITDETERNTKS